MNWPRPAHLVASGCILITACSAARDSSHDDIQAFAVRDSAGVSIAQNQDSTWTIDTRWQVEIEPYLEIGSRAGRGGTSFGRIGPIVRFTDGRVGVADLQALEISVFDRGGEYVGVWGGRGAGPGELQRIDGLALIRSDSLVVTNDGIFRHEIYAPNGTYARTVRAPPPDWHRGGGRAIAWMEDGSFIFGPADVPLRSREGGRVLLHGDWHAFGPAGDHVGELASLPERWVQSAAGLRSPIPVVYGAKAYVAGSAHGLWYGFSANFELRRISNAGVDRVVRRPWAPEPVINAMRTGYTDWYHSQANRRDVDPGLISETVWMRRAEALAPGTNVSLVFADTLPAFVGLVVSSDDHLWVQLPAHSAELEHAPERISTNRWSVFDPEGRWLGTVRTPPDLEVRLIGSDYVLGVWKDALDVEYVRLHRLIKPTKEPSVE